MKLAHFYAFGRSGYGRVDGDELVVFEGSPFEGHLVPRKERVSLDVVHLLPATRPSKIVCVGSNYRAHCVEMGRPIPDVPKLFLKPPSALISHGAEIAMPTDVGRVDFEGELGVVIGRRMSRVSEASALDYVLGYTIVNDVTAREIQNKDVQFTRGKGFDTFCPVGPWVETEVAPEDLRIVTRVNGVVKQDGRTSDMIFSVRALLAFISEHMTLEPGDLIATGTPSGGGAIIPGDTVSIAIEGIGVLENAVKARS